MQIFRPSTKMTSLLILPLALLIIAFTLTGCGSNEPAQEEIPLLEFEDELILPPLPEFEEPLIVEEDNPEEDLTQTDTMDLNPEIEELQSQIAFIQDVLDKHDVLQHQNKSDSQTIEDIEEAYKAETEAFQEHLEELLSTEQEINQAELTRAIQEAFHLQDTEFELLLKTILKSFNQYHLDYRQALASEPAHPVQMLPFKQVAVDRLSTDLEHILSITSTPVFLQNYGAINVHNLHPDDKDKVIGFKKRQGNPEARGVISGFVPHQFSNERLRANQFIEVQYYKPYPDSDENTTLDNTNDQGAFFKPFLPTGNCRNIIFLTSDFNNGTWTPWLNQGNACENTEGVNRPTTYIIAVAVNVQP